MTDRLAQIFEHKAVSSMKFREVQRKHGLLLAPENLVADWKTREGAIELHKGLHWINLELLEFIEAPPATKPEELADVLHFLTEFSILAGYDPNLIPPGEEGYDRLDVVLQASVEDPFVFPDAITNARFCSLAALRIADVIKNKPWKQTVKTERNEEDFASRVKAMWYWFGATVRTEGITAQEIFDQFVRKEGINNNRVDTGV